jgi:profilin
MDCQGNGGVVIVKTIQAILVGIYDENSTPGNATKVVEGLADYLISVNYVSDLICPKAE